MFGLIALIVLVILIAYTLALLGSILTSEAETRQWQHTKLRGLITGSVTGTAAGTAAAFVHSAVSQGELFVGGLVVALACWRIAARQHRAGFIAGAVWGHIPLCVFALVLVSSRLGLAGA